MSGRTPSRPSQIGLLPYAAAVALLHLFAPVRAWIRRRWLYRQFLKGPLADRIVFHPHDTLPRQLEDADAALHGRFRFAGETVEVKQGDSVFEAAPPSGAWAEALHGFTWLPSLAAAGGEPARTLATNLISQWLRRHARYSEPAWAPHVMARRLIALFAHGRMVIANSDLLWRSRLFVSLREQAKMLARNAKEAPLGLPRLEAAAALALSGACMEDSRKRLELGLIRMEEEIAAQILPDGGHIDRSPESLIHAYRLVIMVMDALTAIDFPAPHGLRSAQDRMAPMIRFFRHGDGGLALFNGAKESDARMIAGLLARDEVRGAPFAYARHSGYHRMTAGKAIVVLDCGAITGPFSVSAHAACLALELSSGPHRLIVNCGAARRGSWESALRATAAHSTVTVADTSTAAIISPGFIRAHLGARLVGGPSEIESRRIETDHGWCVEAGHDAYQSAFGIRHERQITLSPQGSSLTGADRLIPNGRSNRTPIPFFARFHIHPDVRVSPSQGGSILMRLPNGEGWRFRAGGGDVSIEESVYLGTDTVRRTNQLVISGAVRDQSVELAWIFEQVNGSSTRLPERIAEPGES